MLKGRKGDFRITSIEVIVETMNLGEISKEKSTQSENDNKSNMLGGRQCIQEVKVSKGTKRGEEGVGEEALTMYITAVGEGLKGKKSAVRDIVIVKISQRSQKLKTRK